uniref:7TM_GPCR_Srx domain-containing protein n=2 Tax=Caenorhabditis tropicalis TaxID=1561998 RepID=A0A1I7UBF9_9PELO
MPVYWSDYVPSSCRENKTVFASSEFLLSAYHFTAIFTIALSIFTFYVIIRKTPRKMKNMKVPMIIAHAWSTNLDIFFTVLAAPFLFFPTAAGLPLGTFGALGVDSRIVAYMGQLSIRVPCPCIEFYEKGTLVLLKGGEFLPFLSITGGLVIVLGQSLFFYGHTAYNLNFVKNARVSESTRALQKKFFGYVTMQMTIPWTIMAGPIVYSLYADRNNYYNQGNDPFVIFSSFFLAANNFAMLCMAMHGFLSTGCMIFIIKPYRDFVVNLVKGNYENNSNDSWGTTTNLPQPSVRLGSVSD